MGMDFWLILMALACPMAWALARLAGASRGHARSAEQAGAREDAAVTINAMTRANARRAMELLMTTEPTRAARIAEKIEANNRTMDGAVKALEALIDAPEDRARLAAIKAARMQYLASLDRIGQLIAEGQRVAASALLLETTLPALDRLIAAVDALSARAAAPTVAHLKRAASPRPSAAHAAQRPCKRVANARPGGPDEWQAF